MTACAVRLFVFSAVLVSQPWPFCLAFTHEHRLSRCAAKLISHKVDGQFGMTLCRDQRYAYVGNISGMRQIEWRTGRHAPLLTLLCSSTHLRSSLRARPAVRANLAQDVRENLCSAGHGRHHERCGESPVCAVQAFVSARPRRPHCGCVDACVCSCVCDSMQISYIHALHAPQLAKEAARHPAVRTLAVTMGLDGNDSPGFPGHRDGPCEDATFNDARETAWCDGALWVRSASLCSLCCVSLVSRVCRCCLRCCVCGADRGVRQQRNSHRVAVRRSFVLHRRVCWRRGQGQARLTFFLQRYVFPFPLVQAPRISNSHSSPWAT